MRLPVAICVLVMMICNCASAAGENLVVFKSVGDVSPELTSQANDWVRQNVGPLTNCGAIKTNKKTFAEIAKIAGHSKEGRVMLILVDQIPTSTQHLYNANGVVILNLAVLRPINMTTAAAKATFVQRVEAESVGGVTASLGMPPCPFIRCALYTAKTTNEIDEKSTNLCPPCLQKWETLSRSVLRLTQ